MKKIAKILLLLTVSLLGDVDPFFASQFDRRDGAWNVSPNCKIVDEEERLLVKIDNTVVEMKLEAGDSLKGAVTNKSEDALILLVRSPALERVEKRGGDYFFWIERSSGQYIGRKIKVNNFGEMNVQWMYSVSRSGRFAIMNIGRRIPNPSKENSFKIVYKCEIFDFEKIEVIKRGIDDWGEFLAK